MEFTNDIVDHGLQGDNEIFSLNKIKTKKQLLELQDTLPGLEFSDQDEDEDPKARPNKKKKILFSKFDQNNEDEFDRDDEEPAADEEDPQFEKDSDQDINVYSDDEENDEENPLLNDLSEPSADKKSAKTNLWFNKEAFDFLKDNDEQNKELLQDMELDETAEVKKEKPPKSKFDSDSESENEKAEESDSDSDDDEDDEDDDDDFIGKGKRKRGAQESDNVNSEKSELKT